MATTTAKRLYAQVTPLFSLDSFDPKYLSKEVIELREAITTALMYKKDELPDALVELQLMPGRLRLLAGECMMNIDDAASEIARRKDIPAHTPYLLGLKHDAGEMILRRMNDALRIETLAIPNPYAFPDHLGRMRQLCLRRFDKKIIIDVSEYINTEYVNFGQRYSGNVVRGLFHPIEFRKNYEKEKREESFWLEDEKGKEEISG